MKKMPRHNYILIFFAINILSIVNTFGAPPPPDPQVPPPGAPIDAYIPILFLIGSLIAFYYFKKEFALNKKAPK
jgi:hypothetical protein